MVNVTVSRKDGYNRFKVSTGIDELELGDIIPRVSNPSSWGFSRIDNVEEDNVKKAIGYGLSRNDLIIIGISGDIITAYYKNYSDKYFLLMASKGKIKRPELY